MRRHGRYWAVGPLVLYGARGPRPDGPSRATVIAGKKLGGAVERNRAKRLLREAFRLQLPYIKRGWDLVWIARPSLKGVEFGRVQAAVTECIKRAHLYEDPGSGGDPVIPADR